MPSFILRLRAKQAAKHPFVASAQEMAYWRRSHYPLLLPEFTLLQNAIFMNLYAHN